MSEGPTEGPTESGGGRRRGGDSERRIRRVCPARGLGLAWLGLACLLAAEVLPVAAASGPSYGGDTSPTGDDVWVSCNPTTGFDSLGGSCVLDRHTGLYTHDPNARDGSFYGASNSHSVVIPEGGGIGTQESPARSCSDLGKIPHFVSGDYWLKPSDGVEAFMGYCDLDSFAGGWLMCYTTSGEVHVSREVTSDVGFGREGYRSDCRNYPFNQLLYVEHDARTGVASEDKAFFSFRGRNALVASRSGYRGSLDSSWGVGLGESGILFDGKGFASTRTPECVQERLNSACRQPLLPATNKLQECPDCYAVRPQKGNATCAGTDASACWCDAFATGGCSGGVTPKHTLRLLESHDAVNNFYAGWVITITSGTGTGQARRILSSEGGSCSSSSYSTRATCLANRATWTAGASTVTAESVWDPLPCSNSKLDGFRCQSSCSPTLARDTHLASADRCKNEVVYSTQGSCEAACKSFDAYSRTYTINYQGLDGRSTTLAAAVGDASTVELTVVEASGAVIAAGKNIKIDDEILYVTQVVGNVVRVQRGANNTTPATHSNGAAVIVMVDFRVSTLPTCTYVCSTTYQLDSPHECTELDWACGYGQADGIRRGYQPEKGTCTGICSCTNAGAATCSDASGTCTCRASTNPHGTSLSSPWHTSIVRMAAGTNLDGCSGPFAQCVGSNPYAAYTLTIGADTRTIIGYSGFYKVVQLDAPLRSAPVPAPVTDTAWSGASGYEMKFAPGCSSAYNNDREKQACSETQLYELMVCDNKPEQGLRGAALSGGFIMTGYNASTGCRKKCEDHSFCEDYRTDWYRGDTGAAHASGIAFKTPGHRPLPLGQKLLSVGIRLVDNENRLGV
jgi:hypothetical protein